MKTFFSLIGALLGLVFVVVATRSIIESRAARHWRKVSGKVRAIAIETSTRQNGYDHYLARVDYEYDVDGRRHSGSRHPGGSSTNRELAERAAQDFRAGQSIDVYVNPQRPDKSTIAPGIHPGEVIAVIAGVLMFVFFGWQTFA